MKKILITICLAFCFLVLNAQIQNGDFSNYTCTGYDAFNPNNCVANWDASHGKPVLNATSGNAFGRMDSHDDTVGSGLVSNFNFTQGVTYDIEFKLLGRITFLGGSGNNLKGSLNVKAVNGLTINNAANNMPTPVNEETIFSEGAYAYNFITGWTTINVSYTPNNNYDQIWFYPFYNVAHPAVGNVLMNIEDVSICPVNGNPSFEMKATYCIDEPIVPIVLPSGVTSYRWVIHEFIDISAWSRIEQYISPYQPGPVSSVDFRSFWNGYQVGKDYAISIDYTTPCGSGTLWSLFIVTEPETHTGCHSLDLCEVFDVNDISLTNPCGGNLLEIYDIVDQVSYPSTPVTFSKSTVLKLVYECCEMFLCLSVVEPVMEHITIDLCNTPNPSTMYLPVVDESFDYYEITAPGPIDLYEVIYSSNSTGNPNIITEYELYSSHYFYHFYNASGCLLRTISVTVNLVDPQEPLFTAIINLSFCTANGNNGAWYTVCDYFQPLPNDFVYVIIDPDPSDYLDYDYNSDEGALTYGNNGCYYTFLCRRFLSSVFV